MKTKLSNRWYGPEGYREILILAIPLIISTGSWSVQSYIDRLFLAWYSTESIAAAMPSGILNYTFMSFFIGTASYITTFIAQYKGAGYPDKIGPALWQGIYLSAAGGIIMLLFVPAAPLLFNIFNHAQPIQELEVVYFRILCYGAFPAIAAATLSGFHSGLGFTWPIMWVNISATAFNIVFDYLLIFGHGGFPEMGIKGAAIATALSGVVALSLYVIIIFTKTNNRIYKIISGFRFDKKLFTRLLRFGTPSGAHFFLDVAAFTLFILFVGVLGTESLAATNISFSINSITFMPMLGLGIAVSVLVGQNQGKNNPGASSKCVWNGFHLTFAYMSFTALLLFTIPDFFIAPFLKKADPAAGMAIKITCRVLLKYIAVYTLLDSFNILFVSALKGAGDTRFVMISNTALSIFLFVIPSWFFIFRIGKGIYEVWGVATFYICALGINFFLRFTAGKWKTMKVIEERHIIIPPLTLPQIPVVLE
ncbi:MAG: MATE family efflux transporter [Spirochaetia bacterium]|jgi:MATE family multidrug resistance protein|nr:MATE family efflux transporter [Spirochaetia bacterium]